MARRSGMSKSHSKSSFRKTADLVHKKNLQRKPMRGGIRM